MDRQNISSKRPCKELLTIVPDEIIDRKDKIGFKTPEDDWFPKLGHKVEPIIEVAKKSKLIHYDEVMKEWKDI